MGMWVRSRRFAERAWLRALAGDDAQSTVEYAAVLVGLLSFILVVGALWRKGEDGGFLRLATEAASHALDGAGAIDIALY
ncbi:MAG: hypothetical protein SOU51_03610 [Collinsella sp.]|nr:hypothetical protein [Collinsella sp.]